MIVVVYFSSYIISFNYECVDNYINLCYGSSAEQTTLVPFRTWAPTVSLAGGLR